MDPRKTAQILRDTYGENAISVAARWQERSRAAGDFWSLVLEELQAAASREIGDLSDYAVAS